MFNRFLFWLHGHAWRGLTPDEIRGYLDSGDIVLVKCDRCGKEG